MYTFKSIFPALLLMTLVSSAHSQLANSPWPIVQHDLQRTGRSTFTGPKDGNLAWIYDGGSVTTAPVISTDGTIYVGADDSTLHAISPDGLLQWKYKADDKLGPASLALDGTIYFCSVAGTIYAIYKNGIAKWSNNIGVKTGKVTLAIDGNGVIYIAALNDNKLLAINSDGSLKWSTNLLGEAKGSPAIAKDGTIYVTTQSEWCLYAIKSDGTEKWVRFIEHDQYNRTLTITNPVIGEDESIFFGTGWWENKLYAFDNDGHLKWRYQVGYGFDDINSSPALGIDGTIYFGSEDKQLYALDKDGALKWKFGTETVIMRSPVIDSLGTIYFSSDKLYALNPDGSVKWIFDDPQFSLTNTDFAISQDGTLYMNVPKYLYAFVDIVSGSCDLEVSNIFFRPENQSIRGNKVSILAQVQEKSNHSHAIFDVFFYDNDKSHLIGKVSRYVPAGLETFAPIEWNTEGSKTGTHTINVKVKNTKPKEADSLNNEFQSKYFLLPNLQDRINAGTVGDTIWVEPGRYHENLHLKSGIVLKSKMGPTNTIIDGRQKGSVVTVDSAEVPAILDGFTITNGKTWPEGGGVNIGRTYFGQTAAIIINNIITNNEAWSGGGIHVYRSPNSVIKNNLIFNNKGDLGAGIYAGQSCCEIHNNTIVNNQGTGIEARGYGGMEPNIRNCIFWGNKQDLSMIAYAYYSDVQDAPSELIQTGSISNDPLFLDPSKNDYSLQKSSPCIDTGDPAKPRDPDGTRADMGWKYYDQSATIARIKGRLTDATTGAPVTMAKICLSGPRTDLVPPNVQGNYVFAVPADTGYAVWVYAPNHTAAQKEHLTAKTGEATVVDFSLTPYPIKITLYPPSDLEGSYSSGKLHLTWQRPKDELAFDDSFYEESVGFLNSQGILAAGPFKPSFYPAKIEKLKVAFDGERAGDRIELLIYLDAAGTATKPASSQLVYTLPNIPIGVGGGFQEIDVSAEGLTLNSGSFFVGIKQVNTVPMYMLLDHSVTDGHGFVDDDLNGTFDNLSSQDIHGALAIRAVVSMPSSGSTMAVIPKPNGLSPAMIMPDSARLLAIENNMPVGLVTRPLTSLKSDRITAAEKEALAMLMTPPQSLSVYRSVTSPVDLSGANKIATLAASTTFFDDMSLGSSPRYYYVVVAKYPSGENIPSNEVYVDIATGVSDDNRRALPEKYALSQNTPNPFNPETLIRYQLPKQAEVRLEIYNVLGELVKILVEEKQPRGYYTVHWNGVDKYGRSVASGIYFYTLRTKDFVQSRKLLLVQ